LLLPEIAAVQLTAQKIAIRSNEVKPLKILVFLHGTVVMHKNAFGKSREEIVLQVTTDDPSLYDFVSYIPIGNAKDKLQTWVKQGAEILYLSSNQSPDHIEKDRVALVRNDFPRGIILYREVGMDYKEIVEKVLPDILIEDDCESIGGMTQMVYPKVSDQVKDNMKSITVREFGGIDHLPDVLDKLIAG
jgi:hypothetical protein